MFADELTMSLRLLLAALLGGLVGLERESLNKAAGFRTHTLVALGSCLIMLTSIEMFKMYGEAKMGDPARLAAQVVSGIGFLGAGTILHSGFSIRGLTTAATLWVVAGIGLAVGAGEFLIAVVTTGIVIVTLVYMSRVELKLKTHLHNMKKIILLVEDQPGQLGRVATAFGQLGIHIRNLEMGAAQTEKGVTLTFLVTIPAKLSNVEICENISKVQGVYQVDIS